MMMALWWIGTKEGVSDLRRFWGGRSDDFTIDEIVSFMDTLPDESSTNRATSDSTVSITTQLIASQLDVMRQIGYGLSGKNFPKHNLIVPKLSREVERQKEKDDEMIQRLKDSMAEKDK